MNTTLTAEPATKSARKAKPQRTLSWKGLVGALHIAVTVGSKTKETGYFCDEQKRHDLGEGWRAFALSKLLPVEVETDYSDC